MHATVEEVAPPAGTMSKLRRMRFWAAACVPAATYFTWVWHYSVNAPISDDWSRAPLVYTALHGDFSVRALWTQYSDARLVISNIAFIAFGFIDHLNLKVITMTSAVIFIATFVVVAVLFRAHLGRPTSGLLGLTMALVWFSLGDAQNAVWAFQIAWYFALLFAMLMIYFLFVWPRNEAAGFALAAGSAIIASLSMTQGFVVWPLGLACLFWRPRARQRLEIGIFLTFGSALSASYLIKYQTVCYPAGSLCSYTYALGHPVMTGRYLFAIIGNVIPFGVSANAGPVTTARYLLPKELLGAALLLSGLGVVVRGLRHRTDRVPLPLLLVSFALLFDAMIIVGRIGRGPVSALENRYLMPNIILVVGLIAEVFARPPVQGAWRVVVFVLAGALVFAVAGSEASFGSQQAAQMRRAAIVDARTAINLGQIPVEQQSCYINAYMFFDVFTPAEAGSLYTAWAGPARLGHLMMFNDGEDRRYRAAGPPPPPRGCA